jgi:Protein of unknown function (DUF5674)
MASAHERWPLYFSDAGWSPRLPATASDRMFDTTVGTAYLSRRGLLFHPAHPSIRRMTIEILHHWTSRRHLLAIAETQFGDMVKAVVDVERGVMAIGGELHADEEAALMDEGSKQEYLWGINLYPAEREDEWIEFDSLINVRPSQGNRSRHVEDSALRDRIRQIVDRLVEAEGTDGHPS